MGNILPLSPPICCQMAKLEEGDGKAISEETCKLWSWDRVIHSSGWVNPKELKGKELVLATSQKAGEGERLGQDPQRKSEVKSVPSEKLSSDQKEEYI